MAFLSTTNYEPGDSQEKILAKMLVNQFDSIDESGNIKVNVNIAPTDTATLGGCTTVTTNGSVAAGALWATFVFSSTFTGTVAGQTLSGANGASLTLPAMGKKYPAIPYTVSAGSITIFTAA